MLARKNKKQGGAMHCQGAELGGTVLNSKTCQWRRYQMEDDI